MNNEKLPIKTIPLDRIEGLYTEARPADLPEGASPLTINNDYLIGSANQRPGIENSYSYAGLSEGGYAHNGSNVSTGSGETPWTNPNNISFNTPGTDATVLLNGIVPGINGIGSLGQVVTAAGTGTGSIGTGSITTSSDTWALLFFAGSASGIAPSAPWTQYGTSPFDNQILTSGGTFFGAATNSGGGFYGNGWALAVVAFDLIGASAPTSINSSGVSGATGSGTHNVSFHSGSTAGNTYIACNLCYDVSGIASPPGTWSLSDSLGNNYQHIVSITEGNNTQLDVWVAQNVVGGTPVITLNGSKGAAGWTFSMYEFDFGVPEIPANLESELLQAVNFELQIPTTTTVTGMQVQINGSESFNSVQATITNIAITSGVLTVTCDGNTELFTEGEQVVLNGLTTATFLNGQTVTVLDPVIPTFTFTALFPHANYSSHSDTGTATSFGAPSADDYLEISLINPAADSVPFTFQLPVSAGKATVGSPTNTWGLGTNLTAALLNDPSFGFNIQAFAVDGQPINFDISGVVLTPYITPTTPQNITYMKTYAQNDGSVNNLFLDGGGLLWEEDAIGAPGILTNIYTTIEPNTYGVSVTANDREFVALSNLQQGTDMPRQITGSQDSFLIDRVSQVGPGVGPVCSASTAGTTILTITQAPPEVLTTNWILLSAQPGDYGSAAQAGNLFTIFDVGSPPSNIVVGSNIVISGFPPIAGNNINNGVGNNPAYYTVASVGGTTYWISFVVPFSGYANFMLPGGATVQATEAVLTAQAQIPNIEVGTQVAVANAGLPGYDNTWTIDSTPNSAQLNITNTSLTSNLATYSFNLISGSNPEPGEFITVTGTTNGNGIFNVSQAVIAAVTSSTFSIGIPSTTNISGSAETGSGVIFGNTVTFDAMKIIGNSMGGSIVTAGLVGAGQREAVVGFITRSGYLTQPSPTTTFQVPVGASGITVVLPTGPPNVVGRYVAFTGANGGQFFYIPSPVSVINNGVTTIETATVVNDNTTTTATFSFSDVTLLSATAIDIEGNNLFALQELGSAAWVGSYAKRLFWAGVQNKINPNILNYSFDGGAGVITSAQFTGGGTGTNLTYPLGWTVDTTNGQGGSVSTSPLFGNAYYIQNTSGVTQSIWGMITQPCAVDENGVPIIEASTDYSVRVTAAAPAGAAQGNLVIDLYRPSTMTQLGSYSVPLAQMTSGMTIFSGSLLSVPLGTSQGAPTPPPPPPPGPPEYIVNAVQTAGAATSYGGDPYVTLGFNSPMTAGNVIILSFNAFDYGYLSGSNFIGSPAIISDTQGNQYIRVNSAQTPPSEYVSYIYYAVVGQSGFNTITIYDPYARVWHGRTNGFIGAVATEFSGLVVPVVIDGSAATGLFSSPVPFNTGTVNTSNAHDLIYSGVFGGANSPAPSGYNFLGTGITPMNGAWNAAYTTTTTAGSYSPEWYGGGIATGNTAAFPIQVSNPPVVSSNATTVPQDLLVRIYATGLPNGGDILIDRMEIFPTDEPVISTDLVVSYNAEVNSIEAYDGVTGFLGFAGENSQPVVAAFTLKDSLYVLKTHSLMETTDNGTEPGSDPGWNVRLISNKVGTTSVNGVDSGEDWAVIAGQPGLFAFDGGEPALVSSEIQSLWNQINWNYGHTIWVKNDIVNRRIMVGVPLKTPNTWLPTGIIPDNSNPTTPNVVLMLSYKQLNTVNDLIERSAVHASAYTGKLLSTEFARKWSIWTIEAASAAFLTIADTTQPLYLGNSVGNSKIYSLVDGSFNDDGQAIPQIYTTYGWPTLDQATELQLGNGRMKFEFLTGLIEGEGFLNVTVFPDSLQSPYAHQLLPNIALTTPMPAGDLEIPLNEVGNRLFVQFSSNAVGSGFTIQTFVMALRQHPWSPVRGSN